MCAPEALVCQHQTAILRAMRGQLYTEWCVCSFQSAAVLARHVRASVMCVLTCSTLARRCLRLVLSLVQDWWTAGRACCACRHSVLMWKPPCRRVGGLERQVTYVSNSE